MIKRKTDKRMLIVTLIAVLCIICGLLALHSCAPPTDAMFEQVDDNVFVPSIYVDSAHDVVCYKYSGQMDCVYVGQ